MKDILKKIIIGVPIVAFFIAASFFFAWRDKQIEFSADVYEKCVVETYGETPVEVYDRLGEFPECDGRL